MVFGSKCSEVVAKFMADNEFRELVISVLLQEVYRRVSMKQEANQL
jgi:hypothetical protein